MNLLPWGSYPNMPRFTHSVDRVTIPTKNSLLDSDYPILTTFALAFEISGFTESEFSDSSVLQMALQSSVSMVLNISLDNVTPPQVIEAGAGVIAVQMMVSSEFYGDIDEFNKINDELDLFTISFTGQAGDLGYTGDLSQVEITYVFVSTLPPTMVPTQEPVNPPTRSFLNYN